MMNYIKSELYRITHTKELYLFTGILTALAFLFNSALYYIKTRYTNTAFSYSNLVASPMMFTVVGMLLAFILYEDSRKNGNLKNTVASGISRVKIFAGKCIVSIAASTFAMIITLAVWILSAELYLPKTGAVTFQDLLMEALVIYLIAVASLISSIVFMEMFQKSIMSVLAWALVWIVIPKLLLYLAMRYHVFYPIAMWIPVNFFAVNLMHVNMSECITIWDNMQGIFRCMMSGAVGIAVFLFIGILVVRKKDL